MLRADEEPPSEVPSRYISAEGYVRLRWVTDDAYIEAYEHRVVAKADRGTQVHHVDGDRTNNDPSNLRVMSPEKHRREHGENGSGDNSLNPRPRIDVEEASRLYDLGLGTERIGKMLGHDPSAVWRALRRAGHPIRPSKGGGPQRKIRPT